MFFCFGFIFSLNATNNIYGAKYHTHTTDGHRGKGKRNNPFNDPAIRQATRVTGTFSKSKGFMGKIDTKICHQQGKRK